MGEGQGEEESPGRTRRRPASAYRSRTPAALREEEEDGGYDGADEDLEDQFAG